MAQQPVTVIADILVEHFEEIEFLWTQRKAAAHSADYVETEIRELDQRISTHREGLQIGGQQAISLAQEALYDEDSDVVFAGTWFLLQLNSGDAPTAIIKALLEGQVDQLAGIGDAICHASMEPIEEALQQAYETATTAVAATAALGLAFHGRLSETNRLPEFFAAEAPYVRRTAWRIVALINGK